MPDARQIKEGQIGVIRLVAWAVHAVFHSNAGHQPGMEYKALQSHHGCSCQGLPLDAACPCSELFVGCCLCSLDCWAFAAWLAVALPLDLLWPTCTCSIAVSDSQEEQSLFYCIHSELEDFPSACKVSCGSDVHLLSTATTFTFSLFCCTDLQFPSLSDPFEFVSCEAVPDWLSGELASYSEESNWLSSSVSLTIMAFLDLALECTTRMSNARFFVECSYRNLTSA